MKRLGTVMLIGLLCALMVAAGCTGIPKTSTAPSAAPTGVPGPSWAGTWKTTWVGGEANVNMVLVQSGSSVTGTYEYNDGKIGGTVQGTSLVGTWDENNGGNTGPFEFVMTPDGKSFNGWWVHTGEDLTADKNNPPHWNGIRVS
jgi:hypothetical protein